MSHEMSGSTNGCFLSKISRGLTLALPGLINRCSSRRNEASVKTSIQVDDCYLCFDSPGEAENAIATIARECRDFELELNAEKTKPLHAATWIDSVWPTDLREFRFGVSPASQAKSLEHFFAKAFEYASIHVDQNVLDYALKRSKGVKVRKDNWHGYETFLLKAARSNATVIPTVAQILTTYKFESYALGVTPANFVDTDPYFASLKAKKISFYNTKKNVTHIWKSKPQSLPTIQSGYYQATPGADIELNGPPIAYDFSMIGL